MSNADLTLHRLPERDAQSLHRAMTSTATIRAAHRTPTRVNQRAAVGFDSAAFAPAAAASSDEPTGDLDQLRKDRTGSTSQTKMRAAATSTSNTRSASAIRAQHTKPRVFLPQPSWSVVAIALIAVAACTWWLTRQRLPEIDPGQVIAINLTEGRLAIEEERYVEPIDHSAVHYFGTVLALDPTNSDANTGMDRIAEYFAALAKHKIVQRRFADAVVAIDSVRRARPEHRRLPYLEEQLRQELTAHVQSNAERVASAENGSGEDMLAAEERAPTTAAREPPIKVAPRTVTPRAVAESDSKPIAVPIAPSTESSEAHDEAPNAAVPGANAEPQVAAQQERIEELLPALHATLEKRLTSPIDDTETWDEPRIARAVPATPPKAVPAAPKYIEPQLIKVVEPAYPRSARIRNIEGWVDLDLSIAPNGSVADARVTGRQGGRSFERAALAAVRQWKYAADPNQPPHANRDTAVRVEFRVEGE